MKIYFLFFFLLFSKVCFGFQVSKTKTDSVSIAQNVENPIKKLNYYRKLSKYYLAKNEYEKYCDVILKKTKIYEKFNDFENGFKVLFEAKKYAEENNLPKKTILINNKISTLYIKTIEYSKSKKYIKESEKLALKIKDNISLESVYHAYYTYYQSIYSDSVGYYIGKKKEYKKYIKDPISIYNYYLTLNGYYFTNNKSDLGLKYADSAMYMAKKFNDIEKIISVKHNIGYYYLTQLKDYQKAKNLYIEILNSDSKSLSLIQKGNAYLNLSFAYEKLGDYKNALDYTNKYLEIHDQVLQGKIEDKANEIETKYYIDKTEADFNKKSGLEKEKNKKLLLVVAALFILAGFVFYFYYQNLLLNQKNKIKEIDSRLQFKIISATLDGQDQERNKISTVLHDHVSAILSSVGLHLSAFESNLTDNQIKDLKKTRELLRDAHDKVRDLSHQLVPPLLVKFGLLFALNDLCEKNSNSILQVKFNASIENKKRYQPEFETKIYFIVSEIFNNIVKHSKASIATLLIEEKENKLYLTITDNGKGFNVKNISASNGFGLTQIKARIKNMNGKFVINSIINEGTVINIIVGF